MTVLPKFIWLNARFGVVGGACYYTNQIGLWGDSTQTELLYKDLYKTMAPYVKQATIEVPELPRISDTTRAMAHSWNSGVISSTNFVANLPSHVYDWSHSAYNKFNQLISDPAPPTI